jgi:hypothetical protein
MALPLVILGVRVGAQVASKLGPRAISALKKMDRSQVKNVVDKVKNAIKSKDTKKLENINQQIKKINKQKGPKNVEAGPSMRQTQRLKKKETKLQQEKTAIAKRKEARKNRAKATADVVARTTPLTLIKKPKEKTDKPVGEVKNETKVNGLAPPSLPKFITVGNKDDASKGALTLSQIAKNIPGVTLGALKEANKDIKDLNIIQKGQKINLPSEEDLSPNRKSVYQDVDISKITMKKQAGGPLRPIPAGNKGLPKLPRPVRNKMGFMKAGGKVQKRAGGGVALRGFGVTRKK